MSAADETTVASPSQTVGPFFRIGLLPDAQSGQVVAPDSPGEHVRLRVRVIDGDGSPVDDSLIELWQPDVGFGRLGTDADGWCTFETIRPGSGPASADPREAPHVNLCLFARGLLRHLYTRIYFDGDAALDADPLLSIVPEDRRHTLVATRGERKGDWEFVVRLQGDGETVFFDL